MLSSLILGGSLIVAAGTIGLAESASSSITYNGCENVTTGAIRLLPSKLPPPYNDECRTSSSNSALKEVTISWNQTGPQGIPGAAGSPGPSGAGQ